MKVVILAGGRGSRLGDESLLRPKPMVLIGNRPILWHIMKFYAAWGFHDFIICLGYKGAMIKEYFANYHLHASDFSISLKSNEITYHSKTDEIDNWNVTLVETGDVTETGGRIKRIASYLEQDDTFFLTYGDGVADVRLDKSLEFHRAHGKLATMTVVRPPSRFGVVTLDGDRVSKFEEKPQADQGRINGGYFVLSTKVIDRIVDDKTIWEREPLASLAQDGQLQAFRHDGFWQPMDTLRERDQLEHAWATGHAPWKIW